MLKAALKKNVEKVEKKPRKNTGRPIRAVAAAAKAAALKEEKPVEVEITETVTVTPDQPQEENMSSSPRHVVVEVGDGAVEAATPQQEAITTQNVAEAIATENPTEYATVRKNVSSSRLFIAALVTGIILGLLVFGGLIAYETYGGNISSFGNFAGSFVKPSPSPTKVSPPTPTQIVLNPADYQIQILNGSGVSGAAGDVETILNDDGFTDTTAGNASEFGFTDTEVAMKSDAPKALFGKIKSSLSGYSVVEVTSLPSDGEFDVVITVGTTRNDE